MSESPNSFGAKGVPPLNPPTRIPLSPFSLARLASWADPNAGQVRVRRHQQVGQPERRLKASQQIAMFGDAATHERQAAPAYYRTVQTRPVAFTFAGCGQELLQERYPGPRPRYCSETCRDEARLEQNRERQHRWRLRHREEPAGPKA